MESIINYVWNDAKFKEVYKDFLIISHLTQFSNIDNFSYNNKIEADNLNYLLKIASLFAHSKNEEIEAVALRIAQHAIEYGNETQKTGSYIVLNNLVNKPSVDLALEKKLISEDTKYNIPIKSKIELSKLESEYNLIISDNENFNANKFQKSFWDAVTGRNKIVSISAPTSAGKSFVVKKWIKKLLEIKNEVNIAIIVPTRALINQIEDELKLDLILESNVNISSMPFKSDVNKPKNKNVYIFTQERMQIFMINNDISFDAVFVDEAHKIDDGSRGVLLQSVLDNLLCKNNVDKIVFASPYVKNPQDIFFSAIPVCSRNQSVIQNQYYLSQESIKKGCWYWNVNIFSEDKYIYIGCVDLGKKKITSKTKATGLLSYNIGKSFEGNLVYADGANQAEEISKIIYDELVKKQNNNSELSDTEEEKEIDSEISDLIELCEKTVHKNFILIKFLKMGIAFHYGSMPHLIRIEIEKLFSKRKIKFLICTSTLLEGVNLSCKNIFINAPKKGKNIEMKNSDIANLAGRAGRLGKEFVGNVFYLDTRNWEAPTFKEEYEVIPSVKDVLTNKFEKLIGAFDVTQDEFNKKDDKVTSVSSFLCNKYIESGGTLGLLDRLNVSYSEDELCVLERSIEDYCKVITIPKEILAKNPITYHLSMQRLFDRFIEKYTYNPEKIIPVMPRGNNFDEVRSSIIATLTRIKRYFNTKYIYDPKMASCITTPWMFGYTIARLISERREFLEKNKKEDKKIESFDTTVRKVFSNVEQIARYEVPKLLSCYVDIMHLFFKQIGRSDLIEDNDLSIFLEFGVSSTTQVSMILLGISRPTISIIDELNRDENVSISISNELTEKQVLYWLKNNINLLKELNKLSSIQTTELEEIIKKNPK